MAESDQSGQLPTVQVQELKQNLETVQKENQQLKQQNHRLSQEALRSEILIGELQQQIAQKDKQIETLQDQLLQIELNSKPLAEQEQQEQQPEEEVTKKQQPNEDIKLGKWEKGPKAPIEMVAGSTVTIGNIAYFNQYSGVRYRDFTVYSFNIDNDEWGHLPSDPPYRHYTLINGCGDITTVGGTYLDQYLKPTDELYTYSSHMQEWIQKFPPMSTKRYHPSALGTETHIIVAGGNGGGYTLDSEILDLECMQWHTTRPLPYYIYMPTTLQCGDTLYIVGNDSSKKLYSVLSCSIPALVEAANSKESDSEDQRLSEVWYNITDLPVMGAAGAIVKSQLLAFGGYDEDNKKSKAVYRYEAGTDTWIEISQMRKARRRCFVAAFVDKVLVAGGEIDGGWNKKETMETKKTEIAQVLSTS